jgi:hypothetical protein
VHASVVVVANHHYDNPAQARDRLGQRCLVVMQRQRQLLLQRFTYPAAGTGREIRDSTAGSTPRPVAHAVAGVTDAVPR